MRQILWLIIRELRLRWFSAVLSASALAAAVAIYVVIAMMHDAQDRETRRVTRDLGFNLRVIPKETDMESFWLTGFSEHTMPQESVERITQHEGISYNHLIATLQQKMTIDGHTVIVTGLSDELFPPGRKKKSNMVSGIEPGTVHAGFEAARRLGWQKGQMVELAGNSLKVARCAPEKGSIDDIRLIMTLADAQQVLGMPGQINEIKAIDCLCLTSDENPLAILRDELSEALPEAKVTMLTDIAEVRARQRQVTEKLIGFVIPVLLVAVALWVGALAWINVRQRTTEIGLLRALGYRGGTLAGLLLGKAVILGMLAAIVGSAVGTYLAVQYGSEIFPVTAKAIKPQTELFWWTLIATPLFAAAVSFLPTAIAIAQDPAYTLRKD